MTKKPYSTLSQGTLLVASPDTEPGLYSRSVVLVCEHTKAGSFGLVINKPFKVEMPEDILSSEDLNNPKVGLRLGGKLQQNQMMLLHNCKSTSTQTLNVCEDIYLGGDLNFLQESLANDVCEHLFLCFGYTGWTIGELEKEFLSGLWYLYPGSKDLVFNTPPEKLWQTILRNMGGKYAAMSMIPEDLSLN